MCVCVCVCVYRVCVCVCVCVCIVCVCVCVCVCIVCVYVYVCVHKREREREREEEEEEEEEEKSANPLWFGLFDDWVDTFEHLNKPLYHFGFLLGEVARCLMICFESRRYGDRPLFSPVWSLQGLLV